MTESRRLLVHFLAALAYRTQKALRGAPGDFGEFRAAPTARTPHELLWHMTGLIGYVRTFIHGGAFAPPRAATLGDEIERFHHLLQALADDLSNPSLTCAITDEQLLQGPFADAMTHAGQLAMLRRLAGAPVPSENFIYANISAANLSSQQPEPVAPDKWWRPEQGHVPPGRRRDGGSPG
jgi:hypothetical protein